MSWFLAILVRGVHTEDGYDSDRMGDLLYKLVEATDAEGAYARALELGEASRETMTTVGGETVTFGFLGLGDLMEITASKLEHGIEVYREMIGRKPHERVREKDMLHANSLNADTFGALAAMMKKRGYSFVTLDSALEDSAYLSPDTYTGPAGITWLYRRAVTRGPGLVLPDEPLVPDWVLKEAGVGSE